MVLLQTNLIVRANAAPEAAKIRDSRSQSHRVGNCTIVGFNYWAIIIVKQIQGVTSTLTRANYLLTKTNESNHIKLTLKLLV